MPDLFGHLLTCVYPRQSPSHALPLRERRQIIYKGGALVCLDQSKAFVKVDHQYLVVVLEVTGLVPDFHSLIAAMYGGIKSTVQTNGYLSESFDIKHLVSQGYSLSLFLYVLAFEPLRRGWRVQGTSPMNWVYGKSVSAYAVDATISVSDEVQLPCVEDALRRYKEVA